MLSERVASVALAADDAPDQVRACGEGGDAAEAQAEQAAFVLILCIFDRWQLPRQAFAVFSSIVRIRQVAQ